MVQIRNVPNELHRRLKARAVRIERDSRYQRLANAQRHRARVELV
jgi:hypothetical protein